MYYLVLGAEVDQDGDIAIVNKTFTSDKELDRAQLVLMTSIAIAKDVAEERGIHESNPDSKNCQALSFKYLNCSSLVNLKKLLGTSSSK